MAISRSMLKKLLLNEYMNSGGSGGGSTGYDVDAQLLFDSISDFPTWFKSPVDDLIKGYKDVGLWDNSGFYCIICIPSLESELSALTEIKSRTILGSLEVSGGIGTYQDPYRTMSTNDGFLLNDSWLDTMYRPSDSMTLNDSSEFMILYEDESVPGSFNYNYLAYNNASRFQGIIAISTSGNAAGYAYDSGSVAQGAVLKGSEGVYINNVRDASLNELVVNGSVIGTNTPSGTLTDRYIWLNVANSNNSNATIFRNQSRFSLWGSGGQGLSETQRDELNTVLSNFQSSSGRLRSLKDKQVVFDGNSFNAIWYHALEQSVQYNLGSDRGIHWDTFTSSGKILRDMCNDFFTDIAPLYDASLSKNVYVINEFTNDYFFNGSINDTKSYMATLVSLAQGVGFDVIVVGQPVRIWNGGSAVADQTTLNLGYDDLNTYFKDNAVLLGYEFVELPDTYWIYRDDYNSDAEYDTACTDVRTNFDYFYTDQIHPNRDGTINVISHLISNAINSI